jgi:hypothetical protein
MDAPRPPGGAPRAPASTQRPQPEPQRKSHQLSLFGFFRRASREEVEEQAAERMEVTAAAAAEAKAAAQVRAAGAPPKRAPGRPRKLPALVLGALAPLPAAQPQKADGGARQHTNWFQ